MDQMFKKKRNIDIVFCIDGTGSMAPCIDNVKENAKRFQFEFTQAMTEKYNSELDSMRAKVIVFRDYECDAEPMVISDFFELPIDEAYYSEFLTGVVASGGGDGPENGFEALYYAMKSEFTTGVNDRQIIVLFTDNDALDLKARAGSAGYPEDMVDMDGLINTWNCVTNQQDNPLKLRERNKRLIIYAPAGTKYATLKERMNRCVYEPVDTGAGMEGIDFKEIIDIIAASASA